jgi:plastocyanin
MKKLYLLLTVFLLAIVVNINGKTYIIATIDYTFSPSTVTINLGDTVKFSLGSYHNAVEVSQSTYNAKDTTGNGGFRLPYGGGIVVLKNTGTHYFVCQPHAMLGMRGIITVVDNTGTGISSNTFNESRLSFKLSPNPANEYVSIELSLPSADFVTLRLFDITGKLLLQDPPKNMPAGTQRITKLLDAQLRPGKYIVDVEGSTSRFSQVLIKY